MHIGIHTGPVIFQDDVYGRTVNLASRIASHATAVQVLASECTPPLLRSGRSFRADRLCRAQGSVGPGSLSGVPGRVIHRGDDGTLPSRATGGGTKRRAGRLVDVRDPPRPDGRRERRQRPVLRPRRRQRAPVDVPGPRSDGIRSGDRARGSARPFRPPSRLRGHPDLDRGDRARGARRSRDGPGMDLSRALADRHGCRAPAVPLPVGNGRRGHRHPPRETAVPLVRGRRHPGIGGWRARDAPARRDDRNPQPPVRMGHLARRRRLPLRGLLGSRIRRGPRHRLRRKPPSALEDIRQGLSYVRRSRLRSG